MLYTKLKLDLLGQQTLMLFVLWGYLRNQLVTNTSY